MRNFRRIVRITLVVIVGLFLHYVLPQKDVARIVNVDSRLQPVAGIQRLFYAQEDAGTVEGDQRDLRLISTERRRTHLFGLVRGGMHTMVYRNEDTGWIWPPYFKFDSSDLQAEAAAEISTSEPLDWVQITHYGWRIRWLTIYPNAISITPVDGPDHRPVPWFNILFLIGLGVAVAMLRAMWMQFRERTLDPLANQAGDRMDEVGAGFAERRSRLRRWLDSWKSKK